jgi:hypothetical protein
MTAWGGSGMMLVVVLQMLVPVVTAVAVVVIAVTLARGRGGTSSDPTDRPGILEQRLEHLDRLLAAGRITDDERSTARARLLGTV